MWYYGILVHNYIYPIRREFVKKIFKTIIWIVIIMNIAAVVTGVIMQSPDVSYEYRYSGGVITKSSWLDAFEIGSYVYMAVVILLLTAAIILIPRIKNIEKSHRTRNIIISIVLIPVSVVIILFSKTIVTGVEEDYGAEYYEFENSDRQVVICEESWGLSGWGTVYQVEADGTAYIIGEFVTDDGYRNYGEYDWEWSDTGVNIRYKFDNSGDYRGVVRAQWVE